MAPAMPTPLLPNWHTLFLILPEIWLVLGMCVVLLLPLFQLRSAATLRFVAGWFLLLACMFSVFTLSVDAASIFHDSLAIDPLSQLTKALLAAFTWFVLLQRQNLSPQEQGQLAEPDYLCLLLGALLGMMLMVSARNLFMLFIAIEAASLPSYALVGLRKNIRFTSEASLKYVVYGAVAASLMLYGISLLYLATGSVAYLPIAHVLSQSPQAPLVWLGLAGLLLGIIFKLAAVPLHFWCPDAFAGASYDVATFLSVASKSAALILLMRILCELAPGLDAYASTTAILTLSLCTLGVITATLGNLLAIQQTQIKRLLAYSSIAQAGYLLMTAPLLLLTDQYPNASTHQLIAAIFFYMVVYFFMNLGAFTLAGLLTRTTGTEDIRDYAGLATRVPWLTISFAVFLLSLFGLPGLGGFWAKVFLMQSMSELGPWALMLVAMLLLNTLLSLYYYVKPLYFMVFMPPLDQPVVATHTPGYSQILLLLICVAMILWTGLLPAGLHDIIREYSTLLSPAATAVPVLDQVLAL